MIAGSIDIPPVFFWVAIAWGTIGAEGGHPNLPRMFGFQVKMRFGS
jgi:hypothetical protein